MGYNPYVDEDGNCLNCGTGQLNFDGKSTGCACSRVADAEYETEQRIIKLLEDEGVLNGAALSDNWSRQIIALIKGEGEKTNFETYLEEQIKNPEVKEAFEQGEGENK